MPVKLERLTALGAPAPGVGGTTFADLQEYAHDLEKLYGPHPSDDWLVHGEQVSYADLAQAAAEELADAGAVDMVVIATPMPDSQARLLPGPLLADRLGGRPLVLGVSDQGAASPFTALRSAAGRIAVGEVRRAAVVLMEQSTLPPEPYPLPPRAGAVVLVLAGADSGDTGLRLTGLEVRRLPPAQRRPATRAGHLRPWYEFAARHAGGPGAELALADRDDELGYECRIRFAAPGPVARVSTPLPAMEARR
ncbi:hypothetical protein G5C51_32570 [Streptomyces sp. A7024]|uniref:Uncharacterized protein n=1 Tax=Streptomyces coryli TaxID=1128680 RepID=A0A6G4U8V2_9ACTN|nr:hypothetical protein [Streptomyces coryli]NGN68614.1 hypothetical protein [Streptomyces coryli]